MTFSQRHELRFALASVANDVAPRQSAAETFAARAARQLKEVATVPLVFRFKVRVVHRSLPFIDLKQPISEALVCPST